MDTVKELCVVYQLIQTKPPPVLTLLSFDDMRLATVRKVR